MATYISEATLSCEDSVEFTWLFLLLAVLLSAIQLGSGVGIGLWLRRGGANANAPGRQISMRADRVLQWLHRAADEMVEEVGQHQQEMHCLRERLQTLERAGEHPPTELVTGVVGR
jgi:hypothetical protein